MFAPRLRSIVLGLAFAGTPVVLVGSGCANAPAPGGATTPMGSWPEWRTLEPLVETASAHVDKGTTSALRNASKLLAEGKARSADQALTKVADGPGRHWISIARADLAALHFSTCIRGVAWRLPDEATTERRVDFSPEARIEPGDVSVEALLTNLDAALASQKEGQLVVQARIARARVAAYTSTCPPNDEVAKRTHAVVESDLAQLAAESHLTPDLAYLWGGIQLEKFSAAAARPFFLQARAGGYDDPSVIYMLAGIALDLGELEEAKAYAGEALQAFEAIGDPDMIGQAHVMAGEVARRSKSPADAHESYTAALSIAPGFVPAVVGLLELDLESEGHDIAVQGLNERLVALEGDSMSEDAILDMAGNVEALVVLTNERLDVAQACRDGLLMRIDAVEDPVRRGIRYFYAATLDVRLGDYEAARGHALFARSEFEDAGVAPPIDLETFLARINEG